MIHKQFEYRRKLVWAALFLIIVFSGASSMIRQRQINNNTNNETAHSETGSYEFSVINFLNE